MSGEIRNRQNTTEISIEDGVGWGHHLLVLLWIVLTLSLLLWAWWSPLDIVSITQGEVIPSSQVKQIQHLEGGIVRRILVQEGDQVSMGQPLVELETAASDADVQEIQARLVTQKLEIARLDAEVTSKTIPLVEADLQLNHAEQVRRSLALFKSHRSRRQETLSSLQEKVIAQQRFAQGIQARIRNRKERLNLVKEQVKISNDLLKRDITNRYNHLELLKERNLIYGSIDEDGMALQGAQAALKEARAKLSSAGHEFEEQARTKLEEVRGQMVELTARLQKFQDSLSRTILTAPVAGVVKTLYVVTEGGVLAPGGTALELVPGGDRLVIEAQLPMQDIGFVRIGQMVKVSLASVEAARFGHLLGRVVHISPDTLETREGIPFYKVRIETDQAFFDKAGMTYRLFPGMIVQAAIHTGQRTVLRYIISPFLSSMDTAMTER